MMPAGPAATASIGTDDPATECQPSSPSIVHDPDRAPPATTSGPARVAATTMPLGLLRPTTASVHDTRSSERHARMPIESYEDASSSHPSRNQGWPASPG